MPRKAKESEEELSIQTAQKKETFATKWFRDYAVNNADDLKIVCELTARSIYEQFALRVDSSNNEILAVIYFVIFMEILSYLRSKEKKWNKYTIQIANSINIGFTNNDNDRNEKVGNFMPIMEYVNVNNTLCNYRDQSSYRELEERIDNAKGSDESNTALKKEIDKTIVDFYKQWQERNMKSNIEVFNDIKSSAFNILATQYHISLRSSEAVFPIFGTFMDNIVYVLKEKYREAYGTDVSEVSMNVLGLFDAFYSYDDEIDKEIIEFTPNIRMKLALKNDSVADKG